MENVQDGYVDVEDEVKVVDGDFARVQEEQASLQDQADIHLDPLLI